MTAYKYYNNDLLPRFIIWASWVTITIILYVTGTGLVVEGTNSILFWKWVFVWLFNTTVLIIIANLVKK